MSHDTPHDAPPRVTVHDEAHPLGVSENAIRAWLRRGTLAGVKHGTSWYVLLRDTDIPVVDAAAPHDVPRDTPVHTTARNAAHEHRDDEIRYLREQLDRALRQLESERERADVLMRVALGRIEALTAGETRQDAAVSTQEGPYEGIPIEREMMTRSPGGEAGGDRGEGFSSGGRVYVALYDRWGRPSTRRGG